MNRWSLCGAAVALCAMLAGCWDTRGYYIVADYGAFAFVRAPKAKAYEEFGIRLKSDADKAPALEVTLSNGKTFRCDSLTESEAKEIFPTCKAYDGSVGGKAVPCTRCKDDCASVVFQNGRLASISVLGNGKFRKVGEEAFLVLPLDEEEMIRVFGKPKEYRRVYSHQP